MKDNISNNKSLSILIPGRNEEWLSRTVQDLLDHSKSDFEILIGLDGAPSVSVIPDDPRIVVVYYPESIGQRAMTNKLCKLSKAKYVAKVDAHCAFEDGWDVKMLQGFKDNGDNIIQVPVMRNLWAFDWKCPKDGKRIYQDKGNVCPDCGGEMYKKPLWIAKTNPQSVSYCFDNEPHFQYFHEYCRTAKYKDDLKTGYTETMSLQGSFFMLTRKKYWELNMGDEAYGSWGSQGIQLACSMWLSGGKCIVNHSTWYAHLFRTKSKVFGFPYKMEGNQSEHAKSYARKLIHTNGFPKQIRPVSWLLDRFAPVRGWSGEDVRILKAVENKV